MLTSILLPERNPLLFYSQRGILYYSTPREESFTISIYLSRLTLSFYLSITSHYHVSLSLSRLSIYLSRLTLSFLRECSSTIIIIIITIPYYYYHYYVYYHAFNYWPDSLQLLLSLVLEYGLEPDYSYLAENKYGKHSKFSTEFVNTEPDNNNADSLSLSLSE